MLNRRSLLSMAPALLPLPINAQARRLGRLVIIGGAEDRLQDRVILRRFVDLCGGPASRIRVLSAASSDPNLAWLGYQSVFAELGVDDCQPIPIPDREAANAVSVVDLILEADGIFLSGGDQRRLMDLIWETEVFRALHVAFHVRGCCMAGTSAGAAVLSRNMLAYGGATKLPEKDAAQLDIGLGLISNAIIDQHFSERGRLGRLLSVLAERPSLLGVGVDEDTALIVERGVGIEIIGRGAVTIVDGRNMLSNYESIDAQERLELLGVGLHVLPSGNSYRLTPRGRNSKRFPASLAQAISLLVEPGPIRG
ncbi:cyanophycinase [Rhodoferax sp. AJA081-3]|uniref:cyanophycinase n=1 Tax=Rhodoferax sp. AJA081-3 TaxID=2752316 RepID=UPI001ADF750F|nr:cyanophycinase [Rhodoferax sp. AJA081-3]